MVIYIINLFLFVVREYILSLAIMAVKDKKNVQKVTEKLNEVERICFDEYYVPNVLTEGIAWERITKSKQQKVLKILDESFTHFSDSFPHYRHVVYSVITPDSHQLLWATFRILSLKRKLSTSFVVCGAPNDILKGILTGSWNVSLTFAVNNTVDDYSMTEALDFWTLHFREHARSLVNKLHENIVYTIDHNVNEKNLTQNANNILLHERNKQIYHLMTCDLM